MYKRVSVSISVSWGFSWTLFLLSFVLSYSDVLVFGLSYTVFYYYLLEACLFSNKRQPVDPGGCWKELERVGGGETIIRKKSNFNKMKQIKSTQKIK